MNPETAAGIMRAAAGPRHHMIEFTNALLSASRWQNFRKGESIFSAGEPTGGLVGLAAGTVAVTSALGAPGSPLVHIFRPGGWIGHGPLVLGTPRVLSLTASEACLVARVSQPIVEKLLEDHPTWWRAIAEQVLLSMHTATNIAVDLLIPDSRRRLAATLLRVTDQRFSSGNKGPAELIATQEELGAMANMTRTTLNKCLRDLRALGLVEPAYGRILILNVDALRAIVDSD